MIPVGVLVMYGAIGVWLALLALSFKRRSFFAFFALGTVLMLALNVRYAIEGAGKSIAFFVGLYDVLHNLGVSDYGSSHALVACPPDNQCTVWGPTYQHHASWGVAFHQRFTDGNQKRIHLLNAHILFNSLAFVMMMVQLYIPGSGKHPRLHRWLGYVSLLLLAVGVSSACMLAAEHGSVVHYGGRLAMFGFWFMALCVCACVVMGMVAARRKDFAGHRRWMIRYAGALWGSFWLFRVLEFILGPLLRSHDAASILVCIWASAPLGIGIAELMRRGRRARPAALDEAQRAAVQGR